MAPPQVNVSASAAASGSDLTVDATYDAFDPDCDLVAISVLLIDSNGNDVDGSAAVVGGVCEHNNSFDLVAPGGASGNETFTVEARANDAAGNEVFDTTAVSGASSGSGGLGIGAIALVAALLAIVYFSQS